VVAESYVIVVDLSVFVKCIVIGIVIADVISTSPIL